MNEPRSFVHAEEDRSFRLALEEARDLGIRLVATSHRDPRSGEGEWTVRGEWKGTGRVRGRWIDDVWVDSDEDYYSQPEPESVERTRETPGEAAWAVIEVMTA